MSLVRQTCWLQQTVNLVDTHRLRVPPEVWWREVRLCVVIVEQILIEGLGLVRPYQYVDQCFLPAFLSHERDPDAQIGDEKRPQLDAQRNQVEVHAGPGTTQRVYGGWERSMRALERHSVLMEAGRGPCGPWNNTAC